MDNKLLDNSQPETKNENITNDNDEEIKIQNLGEIEETIKKEVNEENATQNKTKKRKRKYGIDILRIVSMYLICLLHVLGAGGVLSGGIPQTANYFIAWFLEITAYCGVDCYALISGYIGIEGKYKYSNIIYLWLQVEFYSLIIFLIFQIINKDFDSDKFKENALPVTYERWWYFTAYVGLFSVKPYLDYALNNIPKNVAKWNILFGLIYIMIFARLNENLLYLGAGYTTYWLIILYIVGGYIKKYEPFKKINKIWLIIIWILLIVITWVIKLGIEISSKNNPENNGVADSGDKYISYLSVTIFGTGIIMLELFSRIDLEGKNKKLIKIIEIFAVSSFGVYLIHQHKNIHSLYINLFCPFAYYNPVLLFLASIGTALAFYVGCSIIDYLRYLFFELIRLRKFLSKLEEKFNKKFIDN